MMTILEIVLATLVVTYIIRKQIWKYIHILLVTFRRDIRVLWTVAKTKLQIRFQLKEDSTVFKQFSTIAAKHPQKAAILFEDEVWTFSDLELLSNKVANYFHERGYKKGDCVGLILENCPEYVCMWLGLSKLGVVTALLNTNLLGPSLTHCIKVVNCKGIILGSNFLQSIEAIHTDLGEIQLYEYNRNLEQKVKYTNLKTEMEKYARKSLPICKDVKAKDALLYLYTSGSTGLPKAAVMPNIKYITFTNFAKNVLPNDIVLYCPMPLYHTSGSCCGVTFMVNYGGTVVIRKKFSASSYWKDCARYKCNGAQYIGEMCRYVLNAPYDGELKHDVKFIFGNGLQRNIWKAYVEKFKIEKVYEFYAATEGNVQFINIDNTLGSIGCIPVYLKGLISIALVKYDEQTGDLIRDQNGRYIKCKANEPGLLIGKINPKVPTQNFFGYLDESESAKKILLNVFEEGDKYFDSGDVLVFDEYGYYYFKDRIGDTFRWKGVNVSAMEVEEAMYKATNIKDISVYGVMIPGTEGRAGMAAVIQNDVYLQLEDLATLLKKSLPSYAIPLFIRIVDSIPMTETYKIRKFILRKEGFDLNVIKDKLYFLQGNKYVQLTPQLYNDIINNKIRI